MSTPGIQRAKHRRSVPAKSNPRPVRKALLTATVAMTATGVVVAGGVAADDKQVSAAAPAAGSVAQLSAADVKDLVRDREETVSRSDNRAPKDKAKQAALSADEAPAKAFEEKVDNSDPRSVAKSLLPEYGFSAEQFGCLDALYVSESNWNMHADNPSSSAYGIPQALTETHDMPAGYFDSAEVQIRWGLDYIKGTYGTPCSAWDFKQGNNWY